MPTITLHFYDVIYFRDLLVSIREFCRKCYSDVKVRILVDLERFNKENINVIISGGNWDNANDVVEGVVKKIWE